MLKPVASWMKNKLSILMLCSKRMRALRVLAILSFGAFGTALPVAAVEIDGLQLPDSFQIEDKVLRLNGYGTRHYSLLKIKVYSAALYTAKKINSPAALLDSTDPQVVHLKMHRSASQADAIKAWEYYLDANCINECTLPKAIRAEFLQATAAMKAGDEETYIFSAAGLSLKRNNKLIANWQSSVLAKVVLATWFGAVPTSEQLKIDLLNAKGLPAP